MIGILQDVNAAQSASWSTNNVPTDKALKYFYNGDGTRRKIYRLAASDYNQAASNGSDTVQRGISDFSYFDNGKLNTLAHKTNDSSPGGYGIASYGFQYDPDTARITSYSNIYKTGSTPVSGSSTLRQEDKNFAYDELGQLSEEILGVDGEDLPHSDKLVYKYDATGNRLGTRLMSGDTEVALNPVIVTSTIAAGNRLQQDVKYNYKYDLEGNLVERSLRGTPAAGEMSREVFTWDHRNQLVSVDQYRGTLPGSFSERISYDYDGLGRKVVQDHTVGSPVTVQVTTGYVWADGEVVLDLNLRSGADYGKIDRQYLYGPDDGELMAVDVPATSTTTTTVWTFANTVGSIESYVIFQSNIQSDVQHRTFDAYGIEIAGGRTWEEKGGKKRGQVQKNRTCPLLLPPIDVLRWNPDASRWIFHSLSV